MTIRSLLLTLVLSSGCFHDPPSVPQPDLATPEDMAQRPDPDLKPSWRTELFNRTVPYAGRLDWIPDHTKTVVAFVCGLGYRCGGDAAGVGYYSQDLLRQVRELGLGTAQYDLTGPKGPPRDPGDDLGLVELANRLAQARLETLGMFDVIYVGHGFGGAVALRSAAVHGNVKGVATLGFAPLPLQPGASPQTFDDLLAQGQWPRMSPAVRQALHFSNSDPEAVAADLAVEDEFPRKALRDVLSLYQDASLLELGRLQVVDVTRIPVYLQHYGRNMMWRPASAVRGAREDLIQSTGLAAEFHRNSRETRLALVGWLSQFVR